MRSGPVVGRGSLDYVMLKRAGVSGEVGPYADFDYVMLKRAGRWPGVG